MNLFILEKNSSHLSVAFNNNVTKKYPHHKHLEIVLDSKLDSEFHVDQKSKKCNKLIGLIRRLSVTVPRNALLYTNRLLDLILAMVIFYMINQKMKILKTN